MTDRPDVAGAVALARGHGGFKVDDDGNRKLARVSKDGRPSFVIQIDTTVLHLWMPTVTAAGLQNSIDQTIRRFGIDKNGHPAKLGQPGMHSGLYPFFGTNELTCFNPATLDEAWNLMKAL